MSDEFDVPPFEHDPDWLRTPDSRKRKALDRLEAIREYEAIARERRPGVADAERLAVRAGLSTRQFYSVLKDWARERSIYTLLPLAGRRHARNAKLDAAVRANLEAAVEHALGEEGPRSPKAVLRRVLDDWPKDGTAPPSDSTIRTFVADVLGETAARDDSFSMSVGDRWEESLERARNPGDVVIIDHVAPDFFVYREGGVDDPDDEAVERPALTMAIDLFTGVPVGVALGRGRPTPAMIRAALADAERSTRDAGPVVRPRLLLSATAGEEWRALVADFAAADVRATARWSTRLHHGGPTRRIIGRRLGRTPLTVRKLHERAGGGDDFDPTRHALVTMDEAAVVIADEVRSTLRRKLGLDRFPVEVSFGIAD